MYARAGLLGLTEGAAPHSPWEIARIWAGYALGTPVAPLGVLIVRPASGIAAVASRLQIRHANGPRSWSGAEQHRALELAEASLRYAAIADRMREEGFPRRSGHTVGQTLRLLGYGRGWGRPWLPEEDDLVRDAYAHGESLTPLRSRLGRNRASIAHRAGELELQGTHARANGWRTEPSWTAEDIAVLRRDYGTVPTPELARRLRRPKAGIYTKAGSLGLRHGFMRAFSEDEERAIRVAHRHGVSLTDLGAALTRDVAVVSKHAIRMGVPFSERTKRASRGPKRNRPPVTLEMLLALGDAESEAARQGCAAMPERCGA